MWSARQRQQRRQHRRDGPNHICDASFREIMFLFCTCDGVWYPGTYELLKRKGESFMLFVWWVRAAAHSSSNYKEKYMKIRMQRQMQTAAATTTTTWWMQTKSTIRKCNAEHEYLILVPQRMWARVKAHALWVLSLLFHAELIRCDIFIQVQSNYFF